MAKGGRWSDGEGVEVRDMRDAETTLAIIRERGKTGLHLEDVYRRLYNPDLFLRAYGRIYRNAGAMTKGTTEETVDGMSQRKIEEIIELLRNGRYRWTPVRRVSIPKKDGKLRPLGIPMRHSYCTSLQRGWGSRRERPALPWACLNQEAERRVQERRAGLRKRAMVSGVNRIHHGPCDVDWRPSRTPEWHQSAIVETVTFSKSAATLAEQRPSAR